MAVAVRPSRPEDGPALRVIERLAGERFGEVGLDAVAADEPVSAAVLAEYAAAGRGFVAAGDDDVPVGYVIVDVVDGAAHIEQISVRPDQQSRGVGRALLERVRRWAVETGRAGVTLTTFADVPWNRPLYEHVGFRVLAEDELGPELRAVRDSETEHGLDPTIRVGMRWAVEG